MNSATPVIAGIEEITAAYRKLLGRDPDEERMRSWIAAQLSPEAIMQTIMRSAEYRAQAVTAEEVTWASSVCSSLFGCTYRYS
ncbi:MAG: hypothetical protein ACRDHZ_03250 [Ktedonobacteraceae bacterium]